MGLRRRNDEGQGRTAGRPVGGRASNPGPVDAHPSPARSASRLSPSNSNELVGGEHLRRSRPVAPPPTSVEDRPFPGGRVRLPHIYGAAGGAPNYPAPTGPRIDRAEASRPTSAFEEYFTYESLFEAPTPEERQIDRDNPYNVLGVKQSTPWKEIVAKHRAIVKANHPDHLMGADDATVGAATERLRRANEAYRALEAMRRQLGRDTSAA